MRILVNEFCGHAFQIELSRELARRGHQVLHVYFADNESTPKGNPRSPASVAARCVIEGLHVPVPFAKHSLLTRRRADVAYGRAVANKVAQFKPDVVLSANMPLDAQAILLKATHRQGAQFIFWLQDVYSAAIHFVLKQKLGRLAATAAFFYQRLERKLLRSADAVVCIAPHFAEIALRWGVAPSRLFTIENWAPLQEVMPTCKDNAWAQQQRLQNRFCFLYAGTLGLKHRPELLLALARHLEERGDACLVVIAAGAGADWLRTQAATVGRDVLRLLPYQPYEQLSQALGASDVLLGLLNADAGGFAVPSKMLAYLCAGRPLLLAAPQHNHAATVVARANAGIVVSPEDATGLLQAADLLLHNEPLRHRYANNARVYAESAFSIGPIADRFLQIFNPQPSEAFAKSNRHRGLQESPTLLID